MTPIPLSGGAPGPGSAPRTAGGRLAAVLLPALALATAGCATGGEPEPDPAPVPPDDGGPAPAEPEARDDAADAAAAALDEARRLAEAGSHLAAARLADSLYFRTRSRPGDAAAAAEALSVQARALAAAGEPAAAAARLRELLRDHGDRADGDVPARLAGLLLDLADDPAAAGLLLRRPGEDGDRSVRLARRAARGMSVSELEETLGGGSPSGDALPPSEPAGDPAHAAVRSVLLTELAVARARADRPRDARAAARRALEADPAEEEATRARAVLEGEIEAEPTPVRIGLLVPLSGRYASVGERLREGVELALGAHGGDGPAVEIAAVDAASEGQEIADRVRSLEEQGVVAVIGPLRAGAVARTAASRSDPGLLVLSPTASDLDGRGPAAYTLGGETRREIDAARAAGRWMAGVLGSVPVGAVYPHGATGRRAYLAFRGALGTGEAWTAAAHPYDPEATTLEGPITAVSAFAPRAVFAPGASGSSVLQMAPQLSYYGIRGALVAGGPAWSRPSTVRRLEPSFSQQRVLAAFVDRGDPRGAWERFRASYEKTYRRSLPGNMLPALGHDAALVVLRALEETHPARLRAVGRRAAALSGVEGATGRLRLDTVDRTAEREVLFRVLADRELRPAAASEARAWLESAGRLETARTRSRRQRAAEAVRESGVTLEPPEDRDGEEGGG